jgi:DNA repair protein RadA/Sms
MSKSKTRFICSSCGSDFFKWHGRCPDCGEWNTIAQAEFSRKQSVRAESIPLSSVDAAAVPMYSSGIGEFDLVCGGGITPGSVIIVGGEPGIGKSTLALQVAGSTGALYVCGEESPRQIKGRADRLGIDASKVSISRSTTVEEIVGLADSNPPPCLIIDSIQTLQSSEIPGVPGSVSQIRETAAKLVDFAKTKNVPVILIGHITKEGSIAGPKLLEHMVDTVLYFEGDYTKEFRVLRSFKNRYGSVNEIGLFRMTRSGLEEVKDKNRVFLNPFLSDAAGNAVSASIEGSRPILFEVQSLASFTSFSNPRRMADGFDLNRMILLCAVLEKHAGLKLNTFDVFINVSGGFRINDTGADLAVAMSIASSVKNVPIPEGTGFIAEISLSGEARPVSQCGRRLGEFRLSGFKRAVISNADLAEAKKSGYDGEIIAVSSIQQAMAAIF